MFGMFQGPESSKWIAIWPDFRQTYNSFTEARGDMLNMLWWLSRDYLDGDPEYSNAIMSVWSEVATWDAVFWAQKHLFETSLRGERFALCRKDKEGELR